MQKKFADISYRNWIIAHFVPNFVAMATGGRDVYPCYLVPQCPLPRFQRPPSVRLSVRPSVTLRYSVKTTQAKITKIFTVKLWTAPRTLVYRDKIWCPWVRGFASNEGIKKVYPPLKRRYFAAVASFWVIDWLIDRHADVWPACREGAMPCHYESLVLWFGARALRQIGLRRLPRKRQQLCLRVRVYETMFANRTGDKLTPDVSWGPTLSQ